MSPERQPQRKAEQTPKLTPDQEKFNAAQGEEFFNHVQADQINPKKRKIGFIPTARGFGRAKGRTKLKTEIQENRLTPKQARQRIKEVNPQATDSIHWDWLVRLIRSIAKNSEKGRS